VTRGSLAAFVLLTLVAGCTATSAGTPAPSEQGSGPPSSSSPATGSSQLAQRPREIKLDGLNPCTLWTPDQLQQLAVKLTPTTGGPQEDSSGHQVCTYRSPRPLEMDIGYSARAITDLDASVYLGEPTVTDSSVVEVEGFPAVLEIGRPENASPCMLAISTADQQHLQIQALTRPGVFSVEQACEMTTKAATFAVQNLQTLR
jgi:Protein of unknown function (DUF3558)